MWEMVYSQIPVEEDEVLCVQSHSKTLTSSTKVGIIATGLYLSLKSSSQTV